MNWVLEMKQNRATTTFMAQASGDLRLWAVSLCHTGCCQLQGQLDGDKPRRCASTGPVVAQQDGIE